MMEVKLVKPSADMKDFLKMLIDLYKFCMEFDSARSREHADAVIKAIVAMCSPQYYCHEKEAKE